MYISKNALNTYASPLTPLQNISYKSSCNNNILSKILLIIINSDPLRINYTVLWA